MDPTAVTAIIALTGTVLSAIGAAVWRFTIWFGIRADQLIDNHVALTQKLHDDMTWKHEKLEKIDAKVTQIHEVLLPEQETRSSTKIKKISNA
jgi:hypothetical protein